MHCIRLYTNMIDSSFGSSGHGKKSGRFKKLPRLVGQFIRERREALKISQRALGQFFQPAVTTQFISNVERGVTPLPPSHVPTVCQALKIPEEELMKVLEQEYASRLSDRLGKNGVGESPSKESDFLKNLYKAYESANSENKRAFLAACKNILGVQLENLASGSSSSSFKTPIS